MAGSTRLELATSCVTGRRSNQLNYDPIFNIFAYLGAKAEGPATRKRENFEDPP